jgi:hypothetical protein
MYTMKKTEKGNDVTMKKRIKRILSAALIFSVFLAGTPSGRIVTASSRPAGITMNTKSVLVKVHGKTKLSVREVSPKGASKAVKYEIANRKIARVSKNGTVKGKSAGITTVRVTSKKNKHLHVLIKIVVAKVVPQKVKLKPTSVSVTVGERKKLTARVLPSKVAKKNQKGTWRSEDTGIVSVSAKGVITAVAAGKTKVSFTTLNGKKAVCTVTVNPQSETPIQPQETTSPTDDPGISTQPAVSADVASQSAVSAEISTQSAVSVSTQSAVSSDFHGVIYRLLALFKKEC